MMRSGNKNIVKEAVADARRVKELAIDAAKQKLVEEMTPSLRNVVEKQLRSSIEQEDVDRLRRAKDGYGETEFEEGIKLEGDKDMDKEKDDKELEKESIEAMFPGIREMGDEEEEMQQQMDMAPEGGLPFREMEMNPEDMPQEMGMPYGDEEDEMQYAGNRPGRQIPTLGETKEEDEEEGDMDEEITIDEKALQKAYENVMKTADALGEASVTSGFSDTYPKSEWATEDGPTSDRGLEDKEKDSEPWEKETPKAAQDYQVKEEIEKGLKENQELARYVSYLEEQHAQAISVIKELKRQIHEVNLFNRKVLKVNEMLNKFGKSLTSEQKKLVINKIDEATDTRQVDLVSEALRAAFGSTTGINEGTKRRLNKANSQRRITSGAPNQEVLRESVGNGSRTQFTRMRELAGLVGAANK